MKKSISLFDTINKIETDLNIYSNKAKQVKEAFLFSWNNYKNYTFGSDEIRPVNSLAINDRFQGWGATLVDSLSTLWIMDLKDEFKEAVNILESINFKESNGNPVLFFETVIRFLGGLISCYDLSNEKICLQKAIELADTLLPAFDSPSGYPYYALDLIKKQPVKNGNRVVLAEIGTIQLEFSRLSKITGKKVYKEKAYKVYDKLNSLKKKRVGLYPNFLNTETGEFSSNEISFGALGDSFYEYLLKSYIMDKNITHLKMFNESIVGLKSLVKNYNGKYYFGQIGQDDKFLNQMDHLSFFVPGLLTLASQMNNDNELLDLGIKIVESCYETYSKSKTNLGPEIIKFSDSGNNNTFQYVSTQNNLRPELLESLFYLYKFTGKEQYQDKVWKIFEAFEKYSKTKYGYSGYSDINNIKKDTQHNNVQESFYFAETMKYMYLSFMPRNFINLKEWVFNTEAHPLKINTNIY